MDYHRRLETFVYFCTDDPHRAQSTNPSDWRASNSFGNRSEGYPGIESRNKKTETYLNRPEFELFDLSEDPNELNNLAYDEQYKQVLERLIEKMKAFQLKTGDPWYISCDNSPALQGSGLNL